MLDGQVTEGSLKDIKRRAEKARDHRQKWDKLLGEVYRYVIPYRNAGEHLNVGENLTDSIFDATAPKAAFRFAGRMQQDLTPMFQDFFVLKAGPALDKSDKVEKKQLDEQLASISRQVHAALHTSSFHLAAHEMYLDLFAGTGAMLILRGNKRRPIKCVAVPIYEIWLEVGPYGDLVGIFWRKKFPARQLKTMWPNGKYSDRLSDAIGRDPNAPIEICQAFIKNQETEEWDLTAFDMAAPDDEAPIWTEHFRFSPWIIPRFMVVPGEAYGRGPAMLALPFIKTLNLAREFALKAAALALFGVWTAQDDGVFNPKTAKFEPGAIWTVGYNGGGRGSTLARLDLPGDVNMSSIAIDEERLQIKAATFDDTLPPETGSVRSPTEIIERIKHLNQDLGGVLGRLTLEVVVAVVQRTIDILEQEDVLETKITIDQLIVGLQVLSPIATSQAVEQANRTVQFAQIVAGLFGVDMLGFVMRLETAVPDIGRGLGVAERDLRTPEEAKAMQERVMQIVAEKIAAQQAAAMPAPAAPQPQNVNGATV